MPCKGRLHEPLGPKERSLYKIHSDGSMHVRPGCYVHAIGKRRQRKTRRCISCPLWRLLVWTFPCCVWVLRVALPLKPLSATISDVLECSARTMRRNAVLGLYLPLAAWTTSWSAVRVLLSPRRHQQRSSVKTRDRCQTITELRSYQQLYKFQARARELKPRSRSVATDIDHED